MPKETFRVYKSKTRPNFASEIKMEKRFFTISQSTGSDVEVSSVSQPVVSGMTLAPLAAGVTHAVEINPTTSETYWTTTAISTPDILKQESTEEMPSASSSTKSFLCHLCIQSYDTLPLLEDHANSHYVEHPLRCSDCDFSCVLQQTMDGHDCGKNKNSCHACALSYSTQAEMEEHFKRHLVSGGALFECLKCKHKFSTRRDLQVHSCHLTTTFACSLCEVIYFSRKALTNHEKIHELKKKFTCTTCNTVFATKGRFTKHYSTHASELPFGCNQCDFMCAENHDLKKHITEMHR